MSKVDISKVDGTTKEVWVKSVDIGYLDRLKEEGWTVHIEEGALKPCDYCGVTPTRQHICSVCFKELECEMD